MKNKLVALAVLAAVAVGVYAWVLLRPGPPVEVRVLATASSATFVFNGAVEVYQVTVTATPISSHASDNADAPAEPVVVWRLVQPEAEDGYEPASLTSITYGSRRGTGLRPAPDIPPNGEPLQPDTAYTFEAQTSAGVARAEFVL
ncbi:MAG: hypothetical protein AAF288_07905 [Planctomycetota bacterium]